MLIKVRDEMPEIITDPSYSRWWKWMHYTCYLTVEDLILEQSVEPSVLVT